MAKKKCNHGVKLFDVLGEKECIECVLVRLNSPLNELSRTVHEIDLDSALIAIKRNFNLTERDVLLMGWCWDQWKERNGF